MEWLVRLIVCSVSKCFSSYSHFKNGRHWAIRIRCKDGVMGANTKAIISMWPHKTWCCRITWFSNRLFAHLFNNPLQFVHNKSSFNLISINGKRNFIYFEHFVCCRIQTLLSNSNTLLRSQTRKRMIVISCSLSTMPWLLLAKPNWLSGCNAGATSTKAINKQNTQLFAHKTTLSFRVFCYGTHLPQFVVASIFATETLSTPLPMRNEEAACFLAYIARRSLQRTAFEKCKFFQSVSLQFILFVSVLFNISSLSSFSPTLNLGFEKFPGTPRTFVSIRGRKNRRQFWQWMSVQR